MKGKRVVTVTVIRRPAPARGPALCLRLLRLPSRDYLRSIVGEHTHDSKVKTDSGCNRTIIAMLGNKKRLCSFEYIQPNPRWLEFPSTME
jgi:hypothetical protein